MELKRDALNHFKWLQDAVAKSGGEALLNIKNFVVEVRLPQQMHHLIPQFVTMLNGAKVYASKLNRDSIRFAGWKSYICHPTPEIGQKLKFKQWLLTQGLPTPEYTTAREPGLTDVILKKNISSFGAHIAGPYRQAPDRPLDSENGEFYERYTPGQIVKAWYWASQPVCLELKDMPAVIGDGNSTIRKLATRRAFILKKNVKLETVEELLRYLGGNTLDTVLKQDEKQVIDFRYASVFSRPGDVREIDLPSDNPAFASLQPLGQSIYGALPAESRDQTIYSVDAILGHDGTLWFLEVNFNPFIHPKIYPAMLAGLNQLQAVPAPAQAPAVAMH